MLRAGGLVADRLLGLLLGARRRGRSRRWRPSRSRSRGPSPRRLDRLGQVDDVDAVALREDVRLHLGVPAASLVSEVDTGLKQLAHRDRTAWGVDLLCGSSSASLVIRRPATMTGRAAPLRGAARVCDTQRALRSGLVRRTRGSLARDGRRTPLPRALAQGGASPRRCASTAQARARSAAQRQEVTRQAGSPAPGSGVRRRMAAPPQAPAAARYSRATLRASTDSTAAPKPSPERERTSTMTSDGVGRAPAPRCRAHPGPTRTLRASTLQPQRDAGGRRRRPRPRHRCGRVDRPGGRSSSVHPAPSLASRLQLALITVCSGASPSASPSAWQRFAAEVEGQLVALEDGADAPEGTAVDAALTPVLAQAGHVIARGVAGVVLPAVAGVAQRQARPSAGRA